MVTGYYRSFFTTDPMTGGDFMRGRFLILNDDVKAQLLADFSKEEIIRALKSMSPIKAPVPDGCQPLFYQRT